MKGLLLSLGLVALFALCALCAQSYIPIQPDFQADKITEKWYSIAVATKFGWYLQHKQYLKMSIIVYTPTADGNLKFLHLTKMDRCEMNPVTYLKTDQPGHFRYTDPRLRQEVDLYFVDTNYKEFAITFVEGTDAYTTVSLLGREKKLRPEVLARFRKISLELGYGEDNIIFMSHTDQCMM